MRNSVKEDTNRCSPEESKHTTCHVIKKSFGAPVDSCYVLKRVLEYRRGDKSSKKGVFNSNVLGIKSVTVRIHGKIRCSDKRQIDG